jgi:outer membrane receptor protein involved in Fe transport
MLLKHLLPLGCALGALAAPAVAQTGDTNRAPADPAADASQAEPDQARDIIVTGRLFFRNRTSDPNPVLSYDLEYFQRFEPVSVGEMLKRAPGVTFTSDVLEYDGAQMRGLPPGYTNILINGRRMPGGEADGSFFVDRIPADLVERIELVRAPRADQPSDGVAGVINVITKESATFEGGFVRIGGLMNADGGVRPSGALAYAGHLGQASFWAALNYQERRNPKQKVSLRFFDITSLDAGVDDPLFNNTELQSDIRDGSDLSGNLELNMPILGTGHIRLTGLFVDTNRDENETSLTYEGPDLEFDGAELQHEDIHQQTYALSGDAAIPLGGAELGLAAGWSAYRERTETTESEADLEDLSDLVSDDPELLNIDDDEYTGTASLAFGPRQARFKLGVDFLHKTRDGLNDGDFLSGAFDIGENRYAPYARFTFEPVSNLTIDAGLRYEITRRRVSGEAVETARFHENSLNPSIHFRYMPGAADQVRLSIARTVRRPDYDLISPFLEDESPGDDDATLGNPDLRNERAWGIDLGYERRIAGSGIFGVNFFYRDVSDLIEVLGIGPNPENPDGQLFTPRNVGDGHAWGVEFDLSTPLTFLGLPDTGLFANYTYLDSRTTDPFTGEHRRFNFQPHHVYNIGFIQTLRRIDSSFGVTVSGRSDGLRSELDQTDTVHYQPDLEAFVEHRFGRSFVLRFSVQNILDRRKREAFDKWDGDSVAEILDNRRNGVIDEFEIEREHSGQLFQMTLRAAF